MLYNKKIFGIKKTNKTPNLQEQHMSQMYLFSKVLAVIAF